MTSWGVFCCNHHPGLIGARPPLHEPRHRSAAFRPQDLRNSTWPWMVPPQDDPPTGLRTEVRAPVEPLVFMVPMHARRRMEPAHALRTGIVCGPICAAVKPLAKNFVDISTIQF